jgi:hypothetical protein
MIPHMSFSQGMGMLLSVILCALFISFPMPVSAGFLAKVDHAI